VGARLPAPGRLRRLRAVPGDGARSRLALAGALAVLTGLIILLAGIARLGFVTELLSRPVQLGYLCGIAVTILVGQRA
jgi:MFS superfamily sulfate permease-like transporter